MSIYVPCLIFGPKHDYTLVLNSDRPTLRDVETLAFDRRSDGIGFPDERVYMMDRAEFDRRMANFGCPKRSA